MAGFVLEKVLGNYDLLGNYEIQVIPLLSVVITVGLILAKLFSSPKPKVPEAKKAASNFYNRQTGYNLENIKPMSSDFIWDQTPALKSYPFKDAEYKLTMAIKRLDPQDWLLIEPTYKKTIDTKWKIVNNAHPSYPEDKDLHGSSVFVTPEVIPAITEFYDIVTTYVCQKYPMYFKRVGDKIYNEITKEYIPGFATETTDCDEAKSYLLNLVKTIEEDFIILLKDPAHQNEEDEYYFKGGTFAFAAGFNPADRFNRPLSFVHHPIPGYESKLKTSMNRFFNRIQKGQFVTRSNFSIQTHDLYYVDDQNKGHNKAKETTIVPLREEEADFDKIFYRSERQVLTRLPKSGAVIFSIRTYLEPLSELKKEGPEVSHRLAGAVEKFPPDIAIYKNSVEWGDAVTSYLRKPLET